MPSKRKFETFDPNKSDSNDDDYDATEVRSKRSGRKSPKKSKQKSSKAPKARRARGYRGSDVDEDDDDISDDSLADELHEDSEEEEEPEKTETGRPLRSARKNITTLKESSDEEIMKSESEDESDVLVVSDVHPPSKVIRLKLNPQAVRMLPRTTRAGSAARSAKGMSVEPTTGRARRHTRAHTEEVDEPLIALSNSGHHTIVVQGSASPETAVQARATRGAKGMKVPATSVIIEASNEGSSFSQATQEAPQPMDVDTAETSKHGRTEVADSHETREDSTMYSDRDELAGDPPPPAPGLADAEGDDDDDDLPVVRKRTTRQTIIELGEPVEEVSEPKEGAPKRLLRKTSIPQKAGAIDQTSDFEPGEESEPEEISGSDKSPKKGRKTSEETDYSPRRSGRRGGSARGGKRRSGRNSRRHSEDSDEDLDQDELAEEALALKSGRSSRRRRDPDIIYEPVGRRERKRVDYTIKPMDQIFAADEDAEEDAAAPSRSTARRNNASQSRWERTLHPTYGPFGGGGGPTPVTGVGPWGAEAAGGADSDSSDDENMARPSISGPGGVPATPGGLLPALAQTNPVDPTTAGAPANLGKIKSQKALADADPLGVDQNVDFSKVGGLAGHIDQLKEMVQMPLLYPELFLKFHVTPPRGVLFHGPPGTGKTLLARALAASVGSGGRKITFYMRKGADALSKWVGEAERQLRLLFEEARKTQPSIIFFDEIDGLAPVRSSKQEQIHASIVSTLLALMDGMDGRGQVIVIGATNRPDNIDPALRRPGRFDREFYFPLPDVEGRRSIIDIHTKDWGIDDKFKDNLAHATKGYGGADLRALATEAALNAIQRTYPQIYSSNDKLIVNPDKIKITAKDFMLSIKKMIPSSERATSSGAVPLPKVVEPLLSDQLKSIEGILDGLIPIKKKTTALQEAMYEQYDDADQGFGRETLQQEFEKSRVFRPRLLIGGEPGMGQSYIGSAILNHFEGLHVQNFDLPTIYSDSTRTAETAIVQLFAEVKRHKPSVIYIPGIDTWWHTLSQSAITTFMGLLRSIPPTDPVLVLGICDSEPDQADRNMLRELFGFSKKNRFLITPASLEKRQDFFRPILEYIKKQPRDFPDPVNRKLRKLETLEVAPPPPPRVPTKEEIKALKQKDHQTLNLLKLLLQPIMDQIQKKYRKFRTPVIPQSAIQYLYDEQEPNYVRIASVEYRPFELAKDKDGNPGLLERASQKFFYNIETTTIEERLSNGYYARPKDFVADIRALARDAKNIGDRDRILKANELLANVEVDVAQIEAHPQLADCENVYHRQLERAKEKAEKARKKAETEARLVTPDIQAADENPQAQPETITLGEPAPLGQARPGLFASYSTPDARSSTNGHATASSRSFASHQPRLSNGSSVPSLASTRNPGDDVPMTGTESHPNSQHFDSQTMPPPSGVGLGGHFPPRSRGNTQVTGSMSQFSQRSAFQTLPPDMSPSQLINYASTTETGSSKKPSSGDPSNRTSGGSTQMTNGTAAGGIEGLSQFYSPPRSSAESDGQLPDTQDPMGSQEAAWAQGGGQGQGQGQGMAQSQQSTQASNFISTPQQSQSTTGGVVGGSQALQFPSMHSDNELASTAGTSSQGQTASQSRDVMVEEKVLGQMLGEFVSETEGFSVEELEMVYRECMDCLWRLRGEGDRGVVAGRVGRVFGDAVGDVRGAREGFGELGEEER